MRRFTCYLVGAVLTVTAVTSCERDVTDPAREMMTSPALNEHSPPDADLARLGEMLFFDEDLSLNRNQSCASCHAPEWGFSGPISDVNAEGAVYPGSVPTRVGNRRPPTASYATPSPILFIDKGTFTGGNFWDGRATGEKLGNPAADQAQGPFLNPVEQALRDPACVVYRVRESGYAGLYISVWGSEILDITFPTDIDDECEQEGDPLNLNGDDRAMVSQEYDRIGLSIAAYEASPEVNAFTSKFDASRGGGGKLTKEERRGFALFKGKAGCAKCHIASGNQPLFTDFTFDNLGVPANPENPALLADPGFVDWGLGGFLMTRPEYMSYYPDELGKQKVPTLRNVDRRPSESDVKAFMHNGYFKTLKGVVHFYNTRDAKPTCPGLYTEAEAMAAGCWPVPEVAQNVNTDELGDLGLTEEEEDAIVAFMKALSDGYLQQ